MLDHHGDEEINKDMDTCKNYLNMLMQKDMDFTEENIDEAAPYFKDSVRAALLRIGNPNRMLNEIHSKIKLICEQIKVYCKTVGGIALLDNERESLSADPVAEEKPLPSLYLEETFQLLLGRWEKLSKDFKTKSGLFDLSKVPEVKNY